VSRQIAFLESLGLVYKEADPQDGRAQSIRLTDKGEEKMHQVQDARRQAFRERLGTWPLEDVQTLAEYMERLNAVYGEGLIKEAPAKDDTAVGAPASEGTAKDPGDAAQ
jgi:DNA-binding MarR family transcriptional regulator